MDLAALLANPGAAQALAAEMQLLGRQAPEVSGLVPQQPASSLTPDPPAAQPELPISNPFAAQPEHKGPAFGPGAPSRPAGAQPPASKPRVSTWVRPPAGPTGQTATTGQAPQSAFQPSQPQPQSQPLAHAPAPAAPPTRSGRKKARQDAARAKLEAELQYYREKYGAPPAEVTAQPLKRPRAGDSDESGSEAPDDSLFLSLLSRIERIESREDIQRMESLDLRSDIRRISRGIEEIIATLVKLLPENPEITNILGNTLHLAARRQPVQPPSTPSAPLEVPHEPAAPPAVTEPAAAASSPGIPLDGISPAGAEANEPDVTFQ